MKVIFGEMASILLKGQDVSADKIRAAGFSFQHETLDDFLKSHK